MNARSNSQHLLSAQLFKLIFGLYCIIAVSVTAIQMIEEYRYTQKAIAEELKTYEHIFGPVLAKSLWNLDREQVNDITQGFSEVPIIVGVKIERLKDNNLILYAERNINDFSLSASNQFSYSFPIEYSIAEKSQPLGQATLYSDSSIVLNRVKLGFVFLIINALIKGFALWAIFWWVSKKLLITPLNTLTQSISNLNFDNLSSFNINLNIKNHNELSIIEQSFSAMVAELATAKQHINDFNQSLEYKVVQRTIELEKAKHDAESLTQIAESATRAKSIFLATMSHELRTPMNGIQGMLYLLDQSELNEKQKQHIGIASNSAKELLTLINDILDLSKIEAGKFKIENHTFEVYPLFDELIESLNLGINNNNIPILLVADNIRSLQAIGDPLRLRQILTNLIGNAIKFTHQGQIKITTEVIDNKESSNDAFYLSIAIQDTGIGIAHDNLEHLFDNFTQADSSSTREYGGSGLGLAICKQLCELMGGEINVTSEEGKGSCFKFYITLHNTHSNYK